MEAWVYISNLVATPHKRLHLPCRWLPLQLQAPCLQMGDEHRLGMTGSRVHQGGPPAEESRPSLNQEYEGNLKSISFLAKLRSCLLTLNRQYFFETETVYCICMKMYEVCMIRIYWCCVLFRNYSNRWSVVSFRFHWKQDFFLENYELLHSFAFQVPRMAMASFRVTRRRSVKRVPFGQPSCLALCSWTLACMLVGGSL